MLIVNKTMGFGTYSKQSICNLLGSYEISAAVFAGRQELAKSSLNVRIGELQALGCGWHMNNYQLGEIGIDGGLKDGKREKSEWLPACLRPMWSLSPVLEWFSLLKFLTSLRLLHTLPKGVRYYHLLSWSICQLSKILLLKCVWTLRVIFCLFGC